MSVMYKYAVQNKLRFPSTKGQLTVEQLFDLPLTSANGASLDTIARTINADIKAMGEESFVETNATDPKKKLLQNSLEIVKDVIKTKQEENAARLDRSKKAEQRQKLRDLINTKKDEKLSQASIEELEKQLSELD